MTNSDSLHHVANRLTPFLQKLNTAELRKLSRKIGADLRRSQQKRITAQKNPDGTPYVPRSLRRGQRIRRKMFTKLKTARYLRNFSNAEKVSVGFISRVNYIASVHQYGLTQKQKNRTITYPKRELLGYTDDDIKMIERAIMNYLRE